jgi:hypothetical protein
MAEQGAGGAVAQAMPKTESDQLRAEVISLLPDGDGWLLTPHELLGGETPEQRIAGGDVKSVRDLLYSIVYIGVT